MRKIQFIEDYSTRSKGEVWENCEGQMASELVTMKVAVYIDEGERTAFKLNAPEGNSPDFIVTQEHLDMQPSLVEQGVKLGDKVIITATVIPCMADTQTDSTSDVDDASDTNTDDLGSGGADDIKDDLETDSNQEDAGAGASKESELAKAETDSLPAKSEATTTPETAPKKAVTTPKKTAARK